MSDTSHTANAEHWTWLPRALRPRSRELPGTGRLRLIETTLLVLAGALLAIATINDLARQAHVNERLITDLRTWRSYTGHPYRYLSVEQELFGIASKREVVCGNTVPGPPKARTQVCLAIWGPTVHGVRSVHGGWYLRPGSEDDVRARRYGCFGAAARGRCGA